MNTQGIISVNPMSKPSGIVNAKKIIEEKSKRPISELKRVVRLLLGVTTSVSDSRRQWTFRVILGAILMCFGLMLLHTPMFAESEMVMPGISVAMIIGGAMMACGLLTRIVSAALVILIAVASCNVALATMTGYSLLVCLCVSMAALITGSGRYSLDTLIYNGIFRSENRYAF